MLIKLNRDYSFEVIFIEFPTLKVSYLNTKQGNQTGSCKLGHAARAPSVNVTMMPVNILT